MIESSAMAKFKREILLQGISIIKLPMIKGIIKISRVRLEEK
jgi:hypothetical protein